MSLEPLPEAIPVELIPLSQPNPFAEFLREIAFSERSLATAAPVEGPGAASSALGRAA